MVGLLSDSWMERWAVGFLFGSSKVVGSEL